MENNFLLFTLIFFFSTYKETNFRIYILKHFSTTIIS